MRFAAEVITNGSAYQQKRSIIIWLEKSVAIEMINDLNTFILLTTFFCYSKKVVKILPL